MQLLGSMEIASLVHQPLEDLSAFLAQPLRMPLHAEYLLILIALYRLMMPSVDLAMMRMCLPGSLTA